MSGYGSRLHRRGPRLRRAVKGALGALGPSWRTGASIVYWRSREGHMAHIAQIKRPGLLTRTFFKIGERMFGQVPTPERLMAHRLPLMLGIGGLYGAIEWCGKMGVPAEKLADVLTFQASSRFSERERAALHFCERTTRDDLEMSEECLAQVQEHFTEAEIVELTFIIGYQTFASKFAKAWRLAPQGFSAGI